MATEVLLMDSVPSLGAEGDVVKVADGYARNYLLPKGIAAPVTKASQNRLAKLKEEREAKRREEIAAAKEKAKRLKGVSCTIPVKTAEEGAMYGSVGISDILEALAEVGVGLERSEIVLAAPIKELGAFDVDIRLHTEVKATIKVWVVEE